MPIAFVHDGFFIHWRAFRSICDKTEIVPQIRVSPMVSSASSVN